VEETVAGVAEVVSSFPTGAFSVVVFGGDDVCGDEPPNSLLKKPEMYSIIVKMNMPVFSIKCPKKFETPCVPFAKYVKMLNPKKAKTRMMITQTNQEIFVGAGLSKVG
jgi:hypothetical protein